jgi:hypothetical protein
MCFFQFIKYKIRISHDISKIEQIICPRSINTHLALTVEVMI